MLLHSTQRYDSTREFTLSLYDPIGCRVGLYLKDARCKIIEDCAFPTKRFQSEVDNDRTTETWQVGNSLRMLVEIARFLYSQAPDAAKKVLLLDQVANIYFIMQTHLLLWVVDVLTVSSGPPQRGKDETAKLNRLFLYALLWILPNIALHALDIYRLHLNVQGHARKVLVDDLMNTFSSLSFLTTRGRGWVGGWVGIRAYVARYLFLELPFS